MQTAAVGLSANDLARICEREMIDLRTGHNYVAGRRVNRVTAVRIERAAKALGIKLPKELQR